MRISSVFTKKYLAFGLILFCFSCNNVGKQNKISNADTMSIRANGSYGYDADFLKKHTTKVLELVSADGSGKVLLSADYQGRVMTSTASGDTGTSFGWLNYNMLRSKERNKQFNPVGGEERFWLGPEGGQFSVYFKGKDSFSFANWQVPPFIDTDIYNITQSGQSSVTFTKKASFLNYSGTSFNIDIERKVSLISRAELGRKLNLSIPADVNFVGFETSNKITNTGKEAWTKEKGLLSVWLLGMFTPTPKTVVIIPFKAIPGARDHITDNYFGEIPADRLQVKDSVLYFTCDGKFRSKIGLSPRVAKPMAASFDFEKNVLTIIIPAINEKGSYVNSKWEIQKEPYKGDVINSYNDGPLEDGSQMGPFFEIESSSEAMALKKDETGTYAQTTCHFQGDYTALKQLAQQLLGVDLDNITQ